VKYKEEESSFPRKFFNDKCLVAGKPPLGAIRAEIVVQRQFWVVQVIKFGSSD
jgi:hypothetical protein